MPQRAGVDQMQPLVEPRSRPVALVTPAKAARARLAPKEVCQGRSTSSTRCRQGGHPQVRQRPPGSAFSAQPGAEAGFGALQYPATDSRFCTQLVYNGAVGSRARLGSQAGRHSGGIAQTPCCGAARPARRVRAPALRDGARDQAACEWPTSVQPPRQKAADHISASCTSASRTSKPGPSLPS